MDNIHTKYGSLQGITSAEFYPDGSLRECVLQEPNVLKTCYGDLIPQYQNDGVRRKYVKSVSFYPDGQLKSISLQNAISIRTSLGVFPAELVTFHPNGAVKRLFPLNGKISGFWSEGEEYQLAQEFAFNFPFGSFQKKIIGIQFYDNGTLKSMTFWSRDTVIINSPIGSVEVRIGFSLYPDGRLKTLEPARPTLVSTPIGEVEAFNIDAVGIHGDSNSLVFTADGKVAKLVTSTDQITIRGHHEQFIYRPGSKPSLFNDEKMDTVPLVIEFEGEQVRFGAMERAEYDTGEYSFIIRRIPLTKNGCSGCTICVS